VPGIYTVTGTYPVPGTDGLATGTATLTVTAAGTSASVLEINEVRLTGPVLDPSDVYVELYNSSSAPVNIGGWSLNWKTASGVTGSTVLADPSLAGGVIPAGGHYLLADPAYSLTTVPDQALGLPSGSSGLVGVAIEKAGVVSDSVGYVGTTFASGTGLTEPTQPSVLANSFQIGFVRRFSAGQPVDTGDNATDFDLVAPDAYVPHYGENVVLGVPSPLDSSSPIQVNGIAQSYLLDTGPGETEGTAPNFEFDTFGGNPVSANTPGELIIRRKITNVSSSEVITRLQIRITGLSTYGEQSDPVFGNPSSPASVALLDNVGSPAGTVSTSSGQATIAATALQSSFPVGSPGNTGTEGGLNSVLTVALPLETGSSTVYGLIPGQSVNVAITFFVFQTGSFKFAYNMEDDLEPYTPAATQGAGSPVGTAASGPSVAPSLSGSVTRTGVELTTPPASSKSTVHRKKHRKRKTQKPAHRHHQHRKRH
jgi:hypothetical protein